MTLVNINGKKLQTTQTTYKDLWNIAVSIQSMSPAQLYFSRKDRARFAKANQIRLQSIGEFYGKLQREYYLTETGENGKEFFVQKEGKFVFREGKSENEFNRIWNEYLSQPCVIEE
jgi:hypothetical protein